MKTLEKKVEYYLNPNQEAGSKRLYAYRAFGGRGRRSYALA